LGRLVLAVAAAAAICVEVLAAPARAAPAAQPRAEIEGALDPALRAAIADEIGDTDRPVDNRFEARRRARDAADAAISVLRSEGYYAYDVEPEVGEGEAPTPRVRVTPGPRFTLAMPLIEWSGPAPPAADQAAAEKALGLRPGEPGRAADVVSGEGRIISSLQQHGYADARPEPRQVVVDHAAHTVQPTYHIATGPLVRLGGIELVARGRTNARWTEQVVPWKRGQPYSPELLAELQRRLVQSQVYNEVTVALAPADRTTPDGLRPVVVSLAERKRRSIEIGLSYGQVVSELGASYGTAEGFGADVRWTHYNVLRRADTLALFARASSIDSRLGATLSLPAWRRPSDTLTLDAEGYRASTPAYDATGFTTRADVERRYGRTSFVTVGVSADVSRTEQLEELGPGILNTLGQDVVTFATLANLYRDNSNDPLNPERGWRAGLRLEPTLAIGRTTLPYLRVLVQTSAYLPLDKSASTVLAGRVNVGSIINGASLADIPAPQRFYAGGGGSVRGFGYQAVGPHFPDNTPEGGLSLFESSAEVRHQLTEKWGLVGFVDAGSVGLHQNPDLTHLSVGAGVGARYNLGFGPVRVDVATPITNRRGASPIQIYVSIGQSF
jgi:translocation and assembly module TamA